MTTVRSPDVSEATALQISRSRSVAIRLFNASASADGSGASSQVRPRTRVAKLFRPAREADPKQDQAGERDDDGKTDNADDHQLGNANHCCFLQNRRIRANSQSTGGLGDIQRWRAAG